MIPAVRLALLLACLLPVAAGANPTGGTVTSGSATISSSGSTLNVTTSTSGTVINWNSFSIGAGETTNIVQPSAASATLNRVTGGVSSSISGLLQSNGHVFLVNPNGIVFGSSGSVNAAGFVASTLDIADADFLSGNYRFTANGAAGSIVNNGSLVATTSYLALVAPNIQSTTPLAVPPGGLALVAGDPATLSISGGILTNATAGSNVTGTISVSSISVGQSGSVFIVLGSSSGTGGICGTTTGISAGGCGSGGSILPQPAALPLPTLVSGSGGTVTGSGTTMTVTQTSTTGSINFGSFTTGGSTTLNFAAPSSSSATLHNTGSANVYGALTSSGTTLNSTGSGTVLISIAGAGTPTGANTTALQGNQSAGVALNLEKKELAF
jgi:filamentous hemagglutinin family protein